MTDYDESTKQIIQSLREYRRGDRELKEGSIRTYLSRLIKTLNLTADLAEPIRNLYRSSLLDDAIDMMLGVIDSHHEREHGQSMIELQGSKEAQNVIRSWIRGDKPHPKEMLTAIDTLFPPDRSPTREIRAYLESGVIGLGTYIIELIHFCLITCPSVDPGWLMGYAPPRGGSKWRRCAMIEDMPKAKSEIEGAMAFAQIRELLKKEARNARNH